MNYGIILNVFYQRRNLSEQLADQLFDTEVIDRILCTENDCQWKMIPKEYGSGSTCYRRFQKWNKLNAFKKIWMKNY